jgi:hypothetical protein
MGAAERINAVRGAELAARTAYRVNEVVAQVNAVVAGGQQLERRVWMLEGELVRISREVDGAWDRLPPGGLWSRLRWLVRG